VKVANGKLICAGQEAGRTVARDRSEFVYTEGACRNHERKATCKTMMVSGQCRSCKEPREGMQLTIAVLRRERSSRCMPLYIKDSLFAKPAAGIYRPMVPSLIVNVVVSSKAILLLRISSRSPP